MIDCGCDDCYSCKRPYCLNSCYDFECSSRRDISMVSGNGCEKAYNCINFISREMYIEKLLTDATCTNPLLVD